jgi:hypothetical protein
MSIANLLESLAAVAAAAGQGERALRLGGASEALRRRIAVTTNSPVHKAIAARLEAIRQGSAAQAEWAAGALMSRREAIDFALAPESG